MSLRQAFEQIIKHQLTLLRDEKNIDLTDEEIEKATKIMSNDEQFHDELLDFFEDHINIFGENYGIE